MKEALWLILVIGVISAQPNKLLLLTGNDSIIVSGRDCEVQIVKDGHDVYRGLCSSNPITVTPDTEYLVLVNGSNGFIHEATIKTPSQSVQIQDFQLLQFPGAFGFFVGNRFSSDPAVSYLNLSVTNENGARIIQFQKDSPIVFFDDATVGSQYSVELSIVKVDGTVQSFPFSLETGAPLSSKPLQADGLFLRILAGYRKLAFIWDPSLAEEEISKMSCSKPSADVSVVAKFLEFSKVFKNITANIPFIVDTPGDSEYVITLRLVCNNEIPNLVDQLTFRTLSSPIPLSNHDVFIGSRSVLLSLPNDSFENYFVFGQMSGESWWNPQPVGIKVSSHVLLRLDRFYSRINIYGVTSNSQSVSRAFHIPLTRVFNDHLEILVSYYSFALTWPEARVFREEIGHYDISTSSSEGDTIDRVLHGSNSFLFHTFPCSPAVQYNLSVEISWSNMDPALRFSLPQESFVCLDEETGSSLLSEKGHLIAFVSSNDIYFLANESSADMIQEIELRDSDGNSRIVESISRKDSFLAKASSLTAGSSLSVRAYSSKGNSSTLIERLEVFTLEVEDSRNPVSCPSNYPGFSFVSRGSETILTWGLPYHSSHLVKAYNLSIDGVYLQSPLPSYTCRFSLAGSPGQHVDVELIPILYDSNVVVNLRIPLYLSFIVPENMDRGENLTIIPGWYQFLAQWKRDFSAAGYEVVVKDSQQRVVARKNVPSFDTETLLPVRSSSDPYEVSVFSRKTSSTDRQLLYTGTQSTLPAPNTGTFAAVASSKSVLVFFRPPRLYEDDISGFSCTLENSLGSSTVSLNAPIDRYEFTGLLPNTEYLIKVEPIWQPNRVRALVIDRLNVTTFEAFKGTELIRVLAGVSHVFVSWNMPSNLPISSTLIQVSSFDGLFSRNISLSPFASDYLFNPEFGILPRTSYSVSVFSVDENGTIFMLGSADIRTLSGNVGDNARFALVSGSDRIVVALGLPPSLESSFSAFQVTITDVAGGESEDFIMNKFDAYTDIEGRKPNTLYHVEITENWDTRQAFHFASQYIWTLPKDEMFNDIVLLPGRRSFALELDLLDQSVSAVDLKIQGSGSEYHERVSELGIFIFYAAIPNSSYTVNVDYICSTEACPTSNVFEVSTTETLIPFRCPLYVAANPSTLEADWSFPTLFLSAVSGLRLDVFLDNREISSSLVSPSTTNSRIDPLNAGRRYTVVLIPQLRKGSNINFYFDPVTIETPALLLQASKVSVALGESHFVIDFSRFAEAQQAKSYELVLKDFSNSILSTSSFHGSGEKRAFFQSSSALNSLQITAKFKDDSFITSEPLDIALPANGLLRLLAGSTKILATWTFPTQKSDSLTLVSLNIKHGNFLAFSKTFPFNTSSFLFDNAHPGKKYTVEVLGISENPDTTPTTLKAETVTFPLGSSQEGNSVNALIGETSFAIDWNAPTLPEGSTAILTVSDLERNIDAEFDLSTSPQMVFIDVALRQVDYTAKVVLRDKVETLNLLNPFSFKPVITNLPLRLLTFSLRIMSF